jgi:hypothetical protein
MSRYRYRRTYSWTADLAYVAGLFASDGCMINDGRHLTLVSNDLEILENTKRILGSAANVGRQIGGFGTESLQLQLGDVALYDFFLRAGIHPAKSLTIQSVDVPDKYYPDFFRGHFDGDGSVIGYKDERWANSYMYYTSIVSASKPFLGWMQNANARLAGVTSGGMAFGTRVWTLRYAKHDSRRLFDFMYYGPGLPKLTRKYRKFIDFLSSDPYNTVVAREC